jgi:transcriptional regulator with XRE-family HTH domain
VGNSAFDRARLRRARRAAGLTQLELGARLGVSKTTVHLWEQGGRVPRASRVAAIAAALGVDPEELMTISDRSDTATLADVRQRAGYSQAALAARLGVPPSSLSDMERGRYRPGPHAAAWRTTLGLSAAEFERLWERNHRLFRDDDTSP